MEKKTLQERMKQQDMLVVAIGVSVVFSALTAILGYASLSISYALVFVVFCVLVCMAKDLKELCNGLAEGDE